MRDKMASATDFVQTRQPPSRRDTRKHPDDFYSASTVVTRNPLFERNKFERLLVLNEKPAPTPKKEPDENARYIRELGRRIERDEETKSLPDLSKEVREIKEVA